MARQTLVDKVLKDFSKVRVKKVSVRIPRLKIRKVKAAKTKKVGKIPNSSIVNILIKAAVEKARRERKGKATVEEDRSYIVVKDDSTLNITGGYGTVFKGYGTTPHTTYIDYGKLFSYLGKFRAKNAYENIGNHIEFLNKSTESGSFVLADRDAMDKIGRFDKYMKSPVMDMPIMALSLVPIAGLSSGEWEEIKMMMKLDPVTYTLKTKTA